MSAISRSTLRGSRVGYGSIHRLARDSWLANIPIGKANGIPRSITNVLIKGHKFPVVGAMSMNTTMVDITALHHLIRSGDEVVFIGRQGDEEISTEEMWDSTGVDPLDHSLQYRADELGRTVVS